MRTKIVLFSLVMIALLGALPAQAANKVSLRPYDAKKGYQYVQFGNYFTDADGTKRPILWRVLRAENNEAYLLSEYILFGCPLHGDYENYNRNWVGSDLYAYLNGTFKNDAFSADEQATLLVRTEDEALVTLLSSDEMKKKEFGFPTGSGNSKERLCESTAWAKIQHNPPLWELPATNNRGKWKPLFIYTSGGRKYSPWWSRTPSDNYKHEQKRVMNGGSIGRISAGNSDLGARPVITIDLKKVSVTGGDGSKDAPLILTAQKTKAAKATETPKPTKAAKATETPKPAKAAKATATPKPAKKAAKSSVFSAAADPAYILPEFPALTKEGFLPEGEKEFVLEDEQNGLWLYVSQNLRVQIQRKTGTNAGTYGKYTRSNWTTRWYETHIFCRTKNDILDIYPVNESKYFSKSPDLKDADEIAQDHHLVVAFNTDYFNYRVARSYEKGATSKTLKNYTIGIVIRNGQILFEKTKKATSTDLPPLDSMAFYPDGNTSVHVTGSVTADALIKAGATDVISFGPVLVDKGAVSERAKKFGKVLNPRSAFGMVEPGHYVSLVADGRLLPENVVGVTCTWMAEKLVEMGCQTGINLDGGASGVLIFMGKRLNKVGNYGSGLAANRDYNEMMGFGQSDLVQPSTSKKK